MGFCHTGLLLETSDLTDTFAEFLSYPITDTFAELGVHTGTDTFAEYCFPTCCMVSRIKKSQENCRIWLL